MRLHKLLPSLLLLCLLLAAALAHTPSHPDVKVRVASFNPATDEYNFSCTIPNATAGSHVDPRRAYAIDPIPADHFADYDAVKPSTILYRSYNETIQWNLSSTDYLELVHTEAMYHVYCEVQNYSMPPGSQNMPAEFHVDLRTGPNIDVPNLYVLESEGPNVKFKCDPPAGVTNYDLSWKLRSRSNTTSYPGLNNQRIVNITIPIIGGGWDVVCSVFDRQTGLSSSWDMPLEVFASGPAYVPTIEGCVPGKPCYQVSPDGIVPDGTVNVMVTNASFVDVYLNEVLVGTTDGNGSLLFTTVPGIFNLVLRKDGFQEISTLLPVRANGSVNATHVMHAPPPEEPGFCAETVAGLPVTCSGTITSDTGTACRTVVCSGKQVLACNKPDNTFEMYNQGGPASVSVCLGDLCMTGQGFLKSTQFPICTFSCGNSLVEAGETCDDGNAVGGDGCSATCQFEPVCGNSIHEGSEQCDDGNSADNDGCSSSCVIETFYEFDGAGPPPTLALAIEPNGSGAILHISTTNFLFVLPEDPFTPPPHVPGEGHVHWYLDGVKMGRIFVPDFPVTGLPPGTHVIEIRFATNDHREYTLGGVPISDEENVSVEGPPPVCGDGLVQGNESCDLGSANGACPASCSLSCTLNTCGPPPPVCGNGLVEFPEECDDNNTLSGDGCSATCMVEAAACFAAVNDLPVSCSGTITSDVKSGCRTVVCSGKQVQACNKPGNNAPQYFEMYNQGGPASVSVCLGDLCMENEGFLRSDAFPMCSGEPPAPVCGDGLVQGNESCDLGSANGACPASCSLSCTANSCPLPLCGNGLVEFPEECDDNNTVSGDGCSATCMVEGNVSVTLSIAPWFPQGSNVVLRCTAAGFTPTRYDWFFGDGQKQLFGSQNNVWHTYPGPGSFDASCTATDGATSASGALTVILP